MTLRQKLAVRYAAIVGVCLLALGGLAHHEFVLEPRVRREMGAKKPSGSEWGEYAEMVFHLSIPVVLGLGWWLLRRTLNPINDLARRVERVHADNLCKPLPRSGSGDEVDRLTEVFNTMTERLDQSFRQVREFTLHASHELKTPLTVMRADLESLLREDQDLPAARREWAQGQLDEVQRLADIVDSLALLAKADAGLVPLERKVVALGELVRECFEDGQVLAEAAAVKVELAACDEVPVLGDRHRLRQLLLNLTDNAVKYNHPGGGVTLALRRVGAFAELAISNTGPGIPPELGHRIFERFVRGPDARKYAAEGCGLGLSICKWIVDAHGGSICLATDAARVTTARVRLPAQA